MSHIARSFAKLAYKGDPSRVFGINSSNTLHQVLDPGSVANKNLAQGKPFTAQTALDPGGWTAKPTAPPIPEAPTIDTAAQGAVQQQDLMRRRRGVLANIYAGNNPNPSPPTVGKLQLGT